MKINTSNNHFFVSLVKSGLRIMAGAFLISAGLWEPGAFLIVAEVLGILEEMV